MIKYWKGFGFRTSVNLKIDLENNCQSVFYPYIWYDLILSKVLFFKNKAMFLLFWVCVTSIICQMSERTPSGIGGHSLL